MCMVSLQDRDVLQPSYRCTLAPASLGTFVACQSC